MMTSFSSRKRNYSGERAQAIVEFAIALPILMMLLVGILEVGRMVFIYAAVNNASREAVRYASAFGLADDNIHTKYNYCTGIKEMATRSAFFTPLTIEIYHDTGPGTSTTQYCLANIAADNISVSSGDRITVDVRADYDPMVDLIPLSSRTFTSRSSRTVLGILELSYP